MFTVQIARTSSSGRFQTRDFTGSEADCAAFVAENHDWLLVSTEQMSAAEFEKREIAREWRQWRKEAA